MISKSRFQFAFWVRVKHFFLGIKLVMCNKHYLILILLAGKVNQAGSYSSFSDKEKRIGHKLLFKLMCTNVVPAQ